jgi:hemerythrin-like metal-binding protein
MAIYEWSDMLATGIPVVDEQHDAVLRMLNDLHESLDLRKGKEEIVRAMDSLMSYTTNHHETEEKLMQEHGLPELSAHRSEHLALRQNAAFSGSRRSGPPHRTAVRCRDFWSPGRPDIS